MFATTGEWNYLAVEIFLFSVQEILNCRASFVSVICSPVNQEPSQGNLRCSLIQDHGGTQV